MPNLWNRGSRPPCTSPAAALRGQIPDAVTVVVRVRVRMDNAGEDYEDISDANFSIVTAACAGDLDGNAQVDLADLSVQLSNFGTPSGAARSMKREKTASSYTGWVRM